MTGAPAPRGEQGDAEQGRSEPLLRVDRISKRFGAVTALDEVSFDAFRR